jgi:hypothetical protein
MVFGCVLTWTNRNSKTVLRQDFSIEVLNVFWAKIFFVTLEHSSVEYCWQMSGPTWFCYSKITIQFEWCILQWMTINDFVRISIAQIKAKAKRSSCPNCKVLTLLWKLFLNSCWCYIPSKSVPDEHEAAEAYISKV